ncbi:MAG: hypothetical protein HY777_03485 [Betaproteobacteria bacterium]|nr:hypothetical protein [Betaproteobacteria bacterium]
MTTTSRPKTGGRQKGVQNKVSREVRAAAMLHADKAIEALVMLMASAQNEQVRLAAARELLDRACGRTADAVEVMRFENAEEMRGKPAQTLDDMLAGF